MSRGDVPVAIAGGGPVGLALALLLDRYGVRSVVFNTGEAVSPHPRGNTHNARTMEHYRRLGIAGRVRALGLPEEHPTDVAYFTRWSGYELARLAMPSTAEKLRAVEEAGVTDQVPEPLHRANQVYVEQLLLDVARERPNVLVRFGWRVDGFTQDEAGVSLVARRAGDGAEERWRARFLVGCDGGQSAVRRSLGVHYLGEGAVQQEILGRRAASTHLRLPSLVRDCIGSRRAWVYWALNAELAMALFALNGSDEFSLLTSSVDPDDFDAGALVRLVQRAAGARTPVEVLGHRPWTPGVALIAERFAVGRVLLAGDAAHLFTPTGGFGMNTGIDDVANLSWKLAALERGWGGPSLLASYEQERRPVAVRNTAAARSLNRNLDRIARPPALDEATAAGDAARRELGALLATYGEQYASLGVQLGARYDGSPIVAADGPPPPDGAAVYTPSGVAGGRAPHVWLDAGRGVGSSLFDRLGPGFTLLRVCSSIDASPLVAAAGARGVPLSVLDVDTPEARDLYERPLVLVRPDQHVAWRGDRLPSDPDALLALVVGAARARAGATAGVRAGPGAP